MSAIDVQSVTPTYAWPIPNPDDPADVPTDMSELAVAIENTVKGGALLPKPATNGQWIKGVGGLPVWSAIAPADIPLIPSATPPASPVDGQEWSMVADAANGRVWTFRYRAASASIYKWEYVGGGELRSHVATQEGTANTGFVGLTTPGPSLVVPRAGDYRVELGNFSYNTTAGFGAQMGLYVNGVNATLGVFSGASYYNNVYRTQAINVPTAGFGMTCLYSAVGGGAASFGERSLVITPIRVI